MRFQNKHRAKYDTKAFKKSIGLNGVGVKAVNALSCDFRVRSVRDGKMKEATFVGGRTISESEITDTDQPNGTLVEFTPIRKYSLTIVIATTSSSRC